MTARVTSKAEVLLIDDEEQIRRLLRLVLEESGHAVREADTGQAGLREAQQRHPDIIILDLGLPDMPGVEVLRQLREWSEVPVLILSVFGEEGSKIAGLDAGADDYLTKPFARGELLARLRALSRRMRPVEMESREPLRFGSVEVDLARRRVTVGSKAVRLTTKEFALLRLLVLHHDQVLTHRQIIWEIWGPEAEGRTHYLRIYMMRLRRKLEHDPDTPQFLRTESGIGYRLVSDPAR